MVVKIADPILMREINKFHVLEVIRLYGQVSRVEISKQTLLSATTISAITAALIDEGLVEAVHTVPPGNAGRGRPRVFLQLIADAAYTVGVMISDRKTSVTIANFRGESVHSLQLPVGVARWGGDVVVDLIEDTVRECIVESNIESNKIKGIGIGTPGLQDPNALDSDQTPEPGAYDTKIAEALSARLNIPVKAAKLADLIALAECWFEKGGRDRSIAIVTVDDKVEISTVFNSELYNGASGFGPIFGKTKVCNDTSAEAGDLNTLFSPSHSNRAAKCILGEHFDDSRLAERSVLKNLAEKADQGHSDAISFFDEQGGALGQAVSHVVNLISPHRIIISFGNAAQCRFLTRAFHESIKQNTVASHRDFTEINLRVLDDNAPVRGAVALMLRDVYSSPWTAQ